MDAILQNWYFCTKSVKYCNLYIFSIFLKVFLSTFPTTTLESPMTCGILVCNPYEISFTEYCAITSNTVKLNDAASLCQSVSFVLIGQSKSLLRIQTPQCSVLSYMTKAQFVFVKYFCTCCKLFVLLAGLITVT